MNFGRRGDEELYALRSDPECTKNLATNPSFNPTKRKLHDKLYLDLLNQGDPRAYGNGEVFDNYPYADESVRNFYNRYMNGELTKESAGWVAPSDFETEGF